MLWWLTKVMHPLLLLYVTWTWDTCVELGRVSNRQTWLFWNGFMLLVQIKVWRCHKVVLVLIMRHGTWGETKSLCNTTLGCLVNWGHITLALQGSLERVFLWESGNVLKSIPIQLVTTRRVQECGAIKFFDLLSRLQACLGFKICLL